MADARPRPYHHGDLRAALVRAGVELAREGGPQALTLREATRRAGVSAGAAYRHFASHEDLTFAVGAVGLASLARAIEHRQDLVSEVSEVSELQRAEAMLSGVGLGYIDFALDEPGLFEVAMVGLFTMTHASIESGRGDRGRTPFELLIDAVTGLVALGEVRAEDSYTVAITCWSTVHGFAALATRGPLRELPREVLDEQSAEIVRTLVVGLIG